MIRKFFSCVILAAVMHVSAYSQSLPDVKGFDKSVFDFHFSRAQREFSPERWFYEAQSGIGMAINAWELFALELYDSYESFAAAKVQLAEWGSQELEKQYFAWLCSRFFGSPIDDSIDQVYLNISNSHKLYTYQLDIDENIVHDIATDTPLLIRPGDEGRYFVHDLFNWRSDVSGNISGEISKIDSILIEFLPEVMVFIPESERENFCNEYINLLTSYKGIIEKEYNYIAAREERIFINKRTGDIQSLRRKSENESADMIASRLIAEAEDFCQAGIAGLEELIETASAGNSDLSIMGNDWLELYRQQFEYGLKVWEEAEARFFVRRLEWEQKSYTIYSEGEDAWLNAYKLFQEEQRKWELKIKDLFESGEALFKNASDTLEKAIFEAKLEFEHNINLRCESGTVKIQSLLDMYFVALSGAEIAKNTVKTVLYYYELTDTSDNFENFIADIDRLQNIELSKAADNYTFYSRMKEDVKNQIKAEFSEIFGVNQLNDILNSSALSEDFFLDAYQIALIKAKAVAAYWEKQIEMNNAVAEYANNINSGRITETEGIKMWELAKLEYENSITLYEEELKKLNFANTDIARQQNILSELLGEMNKIDQELNRLNSEYMMLVSFSVKNRYNYLIAEFETVYNEINNFRYLFDNSESGSSYSEYLDNVMQLCFLQNLESIELLYDLYVNGDDEFDSYDAMKEKLNRIPIFENGDQMPGYISGFNFMEGSYEYMIIQYLLEQNTGIQFSEDQINSFIFLLCSAYRSYAEADLAVRTAGLLLFSDFPYTEIRNGREYMNVDWYLDVTQKKLTEQEKENILAGSLIETLSADLEQSYRMLLDKRIETETAALKYVLDKNTECAGEIVLLSHFFNGDSDMAEIAIAALGHLKEILYTGDDLFGGNDAQLMDVIQWFISGGSFFDGSEALYFEELKNYNISYGLLELYNNFYMLSSFGNGEIMASTKNGLRSLYENYNINHKNLLLPDINDIAAAICTLPGDFAENAAFFLFDFDMMISLLPEPLVAEIGRWKKSLVENISLYAVHNNISLKNTVHDLEMKQLEIDERYKQLEEISCSIDYIDEYIIAQLNAIYWEILNDEMIFSFQLGIAGDYLNLVNDAGLQTHWRQLANMEFVLKSDMEIAYTSAWIDGKLLDVHEQSVVYSKYINDMLMRFGSTYPDYADMADASVETIADNISKWQLAINKYAQSYDDMNILGKNICLYQMDSEQFGLEKSRLEFLLDRQKLAFDNKKDEYFNAIGDYYSAGKNYDAQYNTVKSAFNGVEKARNNLDIQDAIRRWASTSYLGQEYVGKENYTAYLEQAQIVLDVLSNLYSNETRVSYANPEYTALYNEYAENYKRMFGIYKAGIELNSVVEAEKSRNYTIYSELISAINEFGTILKNSDSFDAVYNSNVQELINIINVKDGLLSFTVNESGALYELNSMELTELQDYFIKNIELHGNGIRFSEFEVAVLELVKRMYACFNDSAKIESWGLASSYLLREMISKNNSALLRDSLKTATQLQKEKSLGKLMYLPGIFTPKESVANLNKSYQSRLRRIEEASWDKLSEAEKNDLEFFLILVLNGNSESNKNFLQYSALYEYQFAYGSVYDLYLEAKKKLAFFDLFFIWRIEQRDTNKAIAKKIKSTLDETKRQINQFQSDLLNNIEKIALLSGEYQQSCEYLNQLRGNSNSTEKIVWADVRKALEETSAFSSDEIDSLDIDWQAMLTETNGIFYGIVDAVDGLVSWMEGKVNSSRILLDNQFASDINQQYLYMNKYYTAADAFIFGALDTARLSESMENAFGQNAASLKNHLENIGAVMLSGLDCINSPELLNYHGISMVKDTITASYVQGIYSRYNAELMSRQIDWDIQRNDLFEKYAEWQEAIALIISNGRNDWNSHTQKINAAYNKWNMDFHKEYDEMNDAWANAYLSGLLDKESWLALVEDMAQNASSELMAKTIGMEAERMSRNMDTRDPTIVLNSNARQESQVLINELLEMSGLMNKAFSVLDGFSSLSNISVNKNVYTGISDANIIKANAGELARRTNSELAALEAKKLAINIEEFINEMIDGVYKSVKNANDSFRAGMDNAFLIEQQWTRSGSNYKKDIIVNSTLFESAIYKKVQVLGFTDFVIEPIELASSVSDFNLELLDSTAIMILIEIMQNEISQIAEKIFGGSKDNKNTSGEQILLELAELDAGDQDNDIHFKNSGKFGKHIGFAPVQNKITSKINKREEVFSDDGDGELGRLLCDLIYWGIIESYGINKMSMPLWDKPMWDDTNSSFEAPSLRTVTNITNAIGVFIVSGALAPATGGASLMGFFALMGGVNTVDDIVFNGLDYLYGYKTADEAMFEIGKAAVINISSSMIAGAFSGVSGLKEGFFASGSGLTGLATKAASDIGGKLLTGAAMAGAQTLTAGIISSAISGITYNSTDKFGYSADIFREGMKNTLISSVVSMGVSLTNGMLQNSNAGYYYEKLLGFNSGNIEGVNKLNGLISSIAGQGLQFAMTGEFTLNLLNMSLFTGGLIDVGLLELRLGSGSDHLLGFGTSGANVSPDTVAKAIHGGFIWGLNNKIADYVNNNEFKYDIALRAQYGFGDKEAKDQLFNILNGTDILALAAGENFSGITETINGVRTVAINGNNSEMGYADQMRLALTLGHEAHRDGLVAADNALETERAVTAHTMMAFRMLADNQSFTMDSNILRDISAYLNSLDNPAAFSAYINANYDSSADYWKLTTDGKLEYDGLATFVDEKGNVLLSLNKMGLKSEGEIEGALLFLLNVDKNDKEKVNKVRQAMVAAGLVHTADTDPEKWYWAGNIHQKQSKIISKADGLDIIFYSATITQENMGKQIALGDILNIYSAVGSTSDQIKKSINRIYQNPVNFLTYSDAGGNLTIASGLLTNILPEPDAKMIIANYDVYKKLKTGGFDAMGMVEGTTNQSSFFDKDVMIDWTDDNDSSVKHYWENHPGYDISTDGTSINLPKGYWEIEDITGHRIRFQLYGSDFIFRIMHLNKDDLKNYKEGDIYGGENALTLKYPSTEVGISKGLHIHIDMTRNLPYKGTYQRQFVNPATLLPGVRFEYEYANLDINKEKIPGTYKKFYRY